MTSPVSIPAGHKLLAADFDAYENATAAWVTWTPTLTNITNVNGTLTARYRQVGKTVDWYFRFVPGSSSAIGTDPGFSLPATAAGHYPLNESFGGFPSGCRLVDSATAARPGNVNLITATTILLTSWNATPTLQQITATAPWTWATGDSITAWGTYEAA